MCLDNLKIDQISYYNLPNSAFWGWLSMESQPQNPENLHPCKYIWIFSYPWASITFCYFHTPGHCISRTEIEHLLLYGEINGTQYIIVHSFRSSGDDGSSEWSISGDPVSGDPVSGDPVLSDGDVPSYQLEYAPWLFTSLALMIFCVNIHWNGM